MRFWDSLFRRKTSKSDTPSTEWQTYCGFSLAERFDQLDNDQVVFLKQIRFSDSRDETLTLLLMLATGETIAPGMDFEAAVLQILDALNAKAPHEPGNVRREFRKLMDQHTLMKRSG